MDTFSGNYAAHCDSLNKPEFNYHRPLRAVKRYVLNNLDKSITLEHVGAAAGLHPVYFSRYFKAKVGINFTEWLRRVRIERAAGLLVANDDTISEVAWMTGFDSLRTFQRAFKRRMRMTASEFRRRAGSRGGYPGQ